MSSSLLTFATLASTASAAFQGFNYGSTFTNGAVKVQSDYENEFKLAAALPGTNGNFTSGRLYTMIQGGTANEPIQAIPAAIGTKTSLLFGLWASAGQDAFNNEIAALKNTINQYCGQLDGLVAGISVGSEDLYRISPIAIANGEYAGAAPDTLVSYINQVRSTIKDTCLSTVPIGHVDTWTAYVNGSNAAVIEALDWLGMDAYPYFENTKPNALSDGRNLFQSALDRTRAASLGKDVWITETGWPVSGKTENLAVPSTDNARAYWQQVGCALFGQTNTWWYTLDDSAPTTPNPSFGVIDESSTPLYDLSCANVAVQPLSSGTNTRSVNGTSPAGPVLGPAPGPINGTSGPAPGPVNGTSGGAGAGGVAANGSTTSPSGPSGTGAATVPDIAGGSHLDSAAAAVMALVLALALL